MDYILDVDMAIKYGVDEAIMLDSIMCLVNLNKIDNKCFYDDKYWICTSIKTFSSRFPFWSKSQIDRILKSLEKQNAIVSGNYNKNSYDRTKWYTLANDIKSKYDLF